MSNNSAYRPATETRSVIAALVVFLGSLTGLRAATPPNDNFANATVVTGTNLVVTGSNLGASKETGEPHHGEEPGGRSVWWRWTAPGSGSVIIRTAGSSFDTLLGVYTGLVVSNLTTVASNDDFGYLKTSTVGFDVTPGTAHSVVIDGYNARFGDIQMTLDYSDQPLQRPPKRQLR